jgi:O-antigen/teichoic acid export membrane protein
LGILQGRKKFGLLGTSMIIESVLKLIFAISFVFIGFKVFGAILGVIIGIFSGLLMSIFFNIDILKQKKEKASFDGIYPKGITYFVTTLVILLFFSLDIILAKRFFSPEIAGKYAVVSMIGKMIFFGTMAIGKAMFPLTSENYNNKVNSIKIFKKASFFIGVLCLLAILLYGLFPELIIKILYGTQYLDMAPYLVYSAIIFSLLSFSNLTLTYCLSINAIKKAHYLIAFLIIEIGLFSLFHSNLLEYIFGFIVSSIIIFIGSLFILFKWKN